MGINRNPSYEQVLVDIELVLVDEINT